jgi:xylan 1,4-beta-xylosidase
LERRRQAIHASGQSLHHDFQLTTFQGVRPALFNFNTSGQPGGYADFDNYTVEEPRARGIEREIPMGKTITLTSGADGSFLAADTQNNVLVNVAAADGGARRRTPSSRSLIWALGRVALKASNGRFVSAGEDGVVLEGPRRQSQAGRRGIVPMGQPDARRHHAHVA